MAADPETTHLIQSYLDEDSSSQLLAAATVSLALPTILLALRLYARVLTAAKRGWDEFLLPLAWILVVGTCIVCYSKGHSTYNEFYLH